MEKNRANEFTEKTHVNPDEQWELDYWSDRWGVSHEELLKAIQETESREVETLEKHLIERKTKS